MAGMQLVKSGVTPKGSVNISTVVRQASCSRGWLRIVVQYIFGAITVASFIMIVLMSMQTPSSNTNIKPLNCYEQNCRIICNDTSKPYYEDLVYLTSEAELFCSRISLVFLNFFNETIPMQWLGGLRSSIYKLAIIQGNLKYIAPQAFMSLFAGNIETLVFEGVTLSNLMPDSFVGLSSLRQLYFKDCYITDIQRNTLRAVDDTLDLLTISRSGSWDPMNISGSSEMITLTTVDFSFNKFDDTLSNESFTGLQHCRILYLNSCNITALGSGTFDSLHRIEVIYLNNNLLMAVPPGLFNGILKRVNPRPRINLQDNPWYCDCASEDLRNLHYFGVLYVDPTCNTPEELHGKPFSAISTHCSNDSHADVIIVDIVELKKGSSNDVVESFTTSCDVTGNNWTLISPNEMYSCEKNLTIASINSLVARSSITIYNDISKSDWITPKYLLRNEDYSIIQISPLSSHDYGLVWFKKSCQQEIFCISNMPKFLRVYDVYFNDEYTFCPVNLEHGFVRNDKCVLYRTVIAEFKTPLHIFGNILLYLCTGFVCLTFGAVCVYGIIRYNPVLLKGSKRLLFVKHKNVEALVLPPKVPLRSALSNPIPDPNFNVTKLCVLPDNDNSLSTRTFVRMKSTRSDKSTVSYISALQPTEDQLAEWRVKRHFETNFTVSDPEISILSWINDGSSSPEYVSTITYESLK